jgi:hypothetical protein
MSGKAMVVPGWKVCYRDFGRDAAGPSKCGHGGEGGGCALGDDLTDADDDGEMLRVTELVVRLLRVAGVAVDGRNESGVLSG